MDFPRPTSFFWTIKARRRLQNSVVGDGEAIMRRVEEILKKTFKGAPVVIQDKMSGFRHRPDEQILLRRLSVFAGWTLDMAEGICADEEITAALVLDLLSALIDKSLVTFENEAAGEPRYRLLDSGLRPTRRFAHGFRRALRRAARAGGRWSGSLLLLVLWHW